MVNIIKRVIAATRSAVHISIPKIADWLEETAKMAGHERGEWKPRISSLPGATIKNEPHIYKPKGKGVAEQQQWRRDKEDLILPSSGKG